MEAESGRKCEVIRLSDEEFLIELEKKLEEELSEYKVNKKIEELCDLIEVAYRLAELQGVSNNTINQLRIQKNSERGKFEKNIFLIEVNES